MFETDDPVITVRDVTAAEMFGAATKNPKKVIIPKGATGRWLTDGMWIRSSTVEWDGKKGDTEYAAKWLIVPTNAIQKWEKT